jgi:hypothetical protein
LGTRVGQQTAKGENGTKGETGDGEPCHCGVDTQSVADGMGTRVGQPVANGDKEEKGGKGTHIRGGGLGGGARGAQQRSALCLSGQSGTGLSTDSAVEAVERSVERTNYSVERRCLGLTSGSATGHSSAASVLRTDLRAWDPPTMPKPGIVHPQEAALLRGTLPQPRGEKSEHTGRPRSTGSDPCVVARGGGARYR